MSTKKIFEIEFKGLEKEIKSLSALEKQLKDVKEQNKKLAKSTKDESEKMAKNRVEIKALSEAKRKLENRTKAAAILGKQEIRTLADVSRQLTIEKQKIREVAIGSKQFNVVARRIKNLEMKQREANAAMGRGKTFVGEYARGMQEGFTKVASIVGGAIIAFSTIKNVLGGAIEKFKVQEQAVADNITVFGSYSYHLQKVAADIQKVTTVGDEQSISMMTQLKNMGVANSEVEKALKGSIGLAEKFKKVGLSQETALKGIALALKGDFNMLNRYIPALKVAKTEAEKMAIVQENMASGFDLATEAAKTSTGQMEQFTNRVGDVEEQFGEVAQTGEVALLPFLEKLADEFEDTAVHAKELFLGESWGNKIKLVWNGFVDSIFIILAPVKEWIDRITGFNPSEAIKFNVDKSINEAKRLEIEKAIIEEGGLKASIHRMNEQIRTLLINGKITEEQAKQLQERELKLIEAYGKKKVVATEKVEEETTEVVKKETKKKQKIREEYATEKLPIEKVKNVGSEMADDFFAGFSERSEELAASQGNESFAENLKMMLSNPETQEALKTAAVDSFARIGDAVLEGQKARIDAEMDYRKNAINNQYSKELESYQVLKDNGLFTEEQFNAKKEELDRKKLAKEEALKKRAFNQQKKLDAEQVVMDAAVAVAKQLAQNGLPLATPFIIAESATIATQLGIIAARKYPKFATGGVIPNGSESLGGYDNTLIAAHPGEVVLTEQHQAALGGSETFKRIGVPGFASGGVVPPQSPILNAEEVAGMLNAVKVVNVATDTTSLSNKVYNLQSNYEL